ncbi:hypothetical protein YC2023_014216 [Brassica napus]
MVGKHQNHHHHTPHRPRSKTLIFTLLLFSFSLLVILYSFSSSALPSVSYPNQSDRTETSFVPSLEKFLIHKAPKLSIRDDTVHGERDDRKLDEMVFERENRLLNEDPVYPVGYPVKVYVYEMPKKFTLDLLWLFHNTYKETSNATSNGSPVHRLIEQHSVDYWLWADLISPESERRLKSVVRVHQQHEADFFYVPFFTTISFFLLEKQQCKALYREALKWVTDQPAWKRSEGRDHIFPIHHPWSFKTVRKFVKNAIWLLPDMDSTGNWYKPGQVSLEKDLILPYVPNVDRCDAKCLSESAPKRTTLLFFRGRLKRNAGGKIRAKLGAELSGVKDVIITEGTAGEGGKFAAQGGMRRSLFCLCPAGDTPSSARLFDAIVSGCIPVIVSDELELPFEGVAVIVSSSDAIQPGWLINHLRSLTPSQVKEFQNRLVQYSRHFLYSSPAQPLGPEDLTWRMIAGKLVNIKLHTRRSQRVVKGSRSICRCDCWRPNSTASNPLSPLLVAHRHFLMCQNTGGNLIFYQGSRKMEGRYYLVFISFCIIHIVQAQQGFISLDCGLPTNDSPYIEPVTGLVFSSDADHIQSGKSGRIQKDLETLHIKPYLFLRYFPDGVRNCYTLDVLQNIKYLIKAVFVYGNYDGFSPNKWARVDLEGKVNGTVEEVIHVPRSNSLQICLVKTGNSLPFVSALELRLLRNDTYVVPDVSLKKLFRRYYRQSDRLIRVCELVNILVIHDLLIHVDVFSDVYRYPDDVFDRIWSPFFLPEWKQITTTLEVNNSNNFEPPKAALKSAAIPRDVNGTQLTINWTLDNPTEQVHLYFHFAELQPLEIEGNSSDFPADIIRMLHTRKFYIVVNGNVTVDSFVPLDLAVNTVETVVKKCEGGKCSLQLVKSESILGRPPLVNAMEAFTAIKFPNSETDPDDVVSIKILQDTYGLNKTDWQGDPCSPQQYLWSGLNCSYMNMSTSPRIISLDLSNNKLTGRVPEFLANMKSLLFMKSKALWLRYMQNFKRK